ncbi:O-methyltransferase [Kaarinaea lacus]
MSNKTLFLNDQIHNYLLSVSLRDTAIQRQLREETAKLELGIMQIAPEQAQFMALLVQLTQARKIIEIGVFTGYSALAMAQALPEEGRIVACDISEPWTSIAKRHWQQAGVAEKIQLHLAPALQTLEKLINKDERNSFDLAFIDADKVNYLEYYEACLKLLRPKGLLLVDNVLWGGSVADRTKNDDDTNAIRAFNESLYSDDRVDISLVPIGDGLTLAIKK